MSGGCESHVNTPAAEDAQVAGALAPEDQSSVTVAHPSPCPPSFPENKFPKPLRVSHGPNPRFGKCHLCVTGRDSICWCALAVRVSVSILNVVETRLSQEFVSFGS